MKLRSFEQSDVKAVVDLFHEYYPNHELPMRKSLVTEAVAEKDGVLGYGLVKAFPEMYLILDQSLPIREKVSVLKMLMAHGLDNVKDFEYTFARTIDPEFASILQKHFGFRVCPEITLYRKVK